MTIIGTYHDSKHMITASRFLSHLMSSAVPSAPVLIGTAEGRVFVVDMTMLAPLACKMRPGNDGDVDAVSAGEAEARYLEFPLKTDCLLKLEEVLRNQPEIAFQRDDNGFTLIHKAASLEDPRLLDTIFKVELLNGASLRAGKTESCESAISIACKKHHLEQLGALMRDAIHYVCQVDRMTSEPGSRTGCHHPSNTLSMEELDQVHKLSPKIFVEVVQQLTIRMHTGSSARHFDFQLYNTCSRHLHRWKCWGGDARTWAYSDEAKIHYEGVLLPHILAGDTDVSPGQDDREQRIAMFWCKHIRRLWKHSSKRLEGAPFSTAYVCPIKDICSSGDGSFLHMLVTSCGHLQGRSFSVFETQLPQLVIEWKWQMFAEKLFLTDLYSSIAITVASISYLLAQTPRTNFFANGDNGCSMTSNSDVCWHVWTLRALVLGTILVHCVFVRRMHISLAKNAFINREALLAMVVDYASYLILFFLMAHDVLQWDGASRTSQDLIDNVSVMFCIANFLPYLGCLRGFRSTCFLSQMLEEIFYGIVTFLGVFIGCTVFFTIICHLLLRNEDAISNPDAHVNHRTILRSFRSLMELLFGIGESETTSFARSKSPNLAVGILFTYFLCMPIVLLNALIAIMNDLYANASAMASSKGWYSRAKLIMNLERRLSKSDRDSEAISPAFLHILQEDKYPSLGDQLCNHSHYHIHEGESID
eukprot:SAG31_NODE_1172_length_9556_cov_42.164111_3_plen_703_part_00